MTHTDREAFEAWVKDMLSYDPQTGVITWKKKPNRNIVVGSVVGKANTWGHISFAHHGKTYMAHRVAWFLFYGVWPRHQIDHINGDPADNKITNLRDVTQSVNMQNKKGAHSQNKIGFLGVSYSNKAPNKPWRASIKANGRSFTIGRYPTPEMAHQAYVEAKRILHEGNTL